MTVSKRGRGRPKHPRGTTKERVLTLRLDETEMKQIEREAKAENISVSALARKRLLTVLTDDKCHT